MHTFRNFLHFLREPIDRKDSTGLSPLKVFILLLIIDIILMLFLSYGISLFENKGWIDLENHAVTQLFINFPWYWIILLAVLLIPFLEELIFRFPLRFEKNYLLQVPILLISGKDKRKKQTYKNIWDKYFGQIFYLSAITFALMHALNYNWDNTSLWLSPLLVLPQFILALFMGYLRVRFNFFLGFLFHAIHNLIFIGFSLINTGVNNKEIATFEYDSNKITIQQVNQSNSSSKHIGPDTLAFENMSVKNIIESIFSNQPTIITTNNVNLYKNTYLNLSFSNTTQLDDKQRNKIIMESLAEYLQFDYNKYPSSQYRFTISISNEEILKNHHSLSSSNNVNIIFSSKNVIFENIPLSELTENFKTYYPHFFNYIGKDTLRYNFQFTSDNLDTIRETLKQEYGLLMEKTVIEADSIHVQFK